MGVDPSDVESLEPPDGGGGLSATVERGTAGVRVVLDGELDYATAPRLREVVAGLNYARGQEVELDLTGLSFLDLPGLRVLVEVRRTVEEAGGHLRLHGAGSQPRWLARLVGLENFLDIDDGDGHRSKRDP